MKFVDYLFGDWTKNFVVKAASADEEEELVDPHDTLKEQYRDSAHCKSFLAKLEECNTRVNSKSETTETCAEELFDLLHCVDHCIAPKLFAKLK